MNGFPEMCGIFGLANRSRSDQPPLDGAAILASLRHRGPDDSGSAEIEGGGLRCSFHQTRLSILDLSPAGHQPMATADGRYWVVFNGEIYNHAALRAELEMCGAHFRSRCDTEVVLEAYAAWGAACLARFRGIFAIAVFDTRDGRLFLARDHLGVKPLYLARVEGGLAFASEVRTLLVAGVARRKLSREGLANYLAFGSFGSRQSAIEGVFSLPPASWLVLDSAGERVGTFWQVPEADAEETVVREERSSELRAALQSSVKLQLEADVPVGVFLSGGMDSAGLAALCSAASQQPVHTFTVSFEEEQESEAARAAAIASRFGCEHHAVRLVGSRLVAEVDQVISALDQPSVDGVNTYFVSQAARQTGLKVALSGLGADEIFAGYRYFRQFERLVQWKPVLAQLAWTASLLAPGALLWRLPSRARKALALAGAESREALYGAMRTIFTGPERLALLRAAPEVAPIPPLPAAARAHPVSAYGMLEIANYLHNTLLRDSDAMSMAHGLELRVPYLDHTVVELSMRTPGSWKITKGQNKPLLGLAIPEIPGEIARRPKLGFTLPFDEWFRGSLRGWMEARLLGTGNGSGLFRREALQALWAGFLRGDGSVTHARVWSIAALLAWCEHNGIDCS